MLKYKRVKRSLIKINVSSHAGELVVLDEESGSYRKQLKQT
jgi:uncharacterized protein Veg